MKKLEFKTSKGEFILEESSDKHLGRVLVKYMTEEQFAEVVDISFDTPRMYRDYFNNMPGFTAKESFESLIKSLGWYLWENPVPPYAPNDVDFHESAKKWFEAESKTLYNPILLKKL